MIWAHEVMSQSAQSPYTSLGLGDIVQPLEVSNIAMGGTAIAYPSNNSFNLMNPAILGMRGYYTSFEIGFGGETRHISLDTLSQSNSSANLQYLSLVFPIKQSKIHTGFGIAPYSYVNYNIGTREQIEGIEQQTYINYKGNGGINSVFWSTGFNLLKSLFLGAKISYLFGSRIDETTAEIGNPNSYVTALYEQTHYNDFNVGFGMAYQLKTGEKSMLFLGGIYELENSLNASKQERLERRQQGTGNVSSIDTIFTNIKGNILLPRKYGIGISYASGTKWLLSSDVIMQDWNDYTDFNGESGMLARSLRSSLGMEYVPDATSVTSYLKRVIYKAGFNYEKTPFMVNSKQIYQFGINFGVSLPVINRNLPSFVNLACQLGQRNGKVDGAITENYFRISLGLTVNDIWFYRRKIE